MPRRYLLLLIVFPIAAAPAILSTGERRDLQRAARTYAESSRVTATVTGTETHSTYGRKGSSSTLYLVNLDAPDGLIRRKVTREDWERATKGEQTPWFQDPRGGWGCSELERAHLTDPASYVVFLFMALAVATLCGLGWWQGLPGGAAAGTVKPGGEPCPETRNLKLPEPEREATKGLDRWLLGRYPRPRSLVGVTLAGALAIGLPAGLMGSVETTALMAYQGLLGAAVILLAHVRGTRRDRLLWRRGVERHAVASVEKRTGNVHSYVVTFDLDGRVYTLRQRLPLESEGLIAAQGRYVVLVDPESPRRATVVPRDALW